MIEKLSYKANWSPEGLSKINEIIDALPAVEEKKEEPKIISAYCTLNHKQYFIVHPESNYCARCGAKRPEATAKKKLAEVLLHEAEKIMSSEVTDKMKNMYLEDWLAKAALDYVLEKIHEEICKCNTSDGVQALENLRSRLKREAE